MKSDSNGCSTCPQGCESFETFTSRGKVKVQYDYRTPEGELFTCIAESLEVARQRRDEWLKVTTNAVA